MCSSSCTSSCHKGTWGYCACRPAASLRYEQVIVAKTHSCTIFLLRFTYERLDPLRVCRTPLSLAWHKVFSNCDSLSLPFLPPSSPSPIAPPPPKSVFTGSLGCGNLRERRASGLVFCESNTSEYRKICVSALPCPHPSTPLDPDPAPLPHSCIPTSVRCCGLHSQRGKTVTPGMCWSARRCSNISRRLT